MNAVTLICDHPINRCDQIIPTLQIIIWVKAELEYASRQKSLLNITIHSIPIPHRMKSDDDFFISAQTKLRATLADAFKEISALKTELSELKAENSELKFRNKDICEELKDTQAALGRAVVNANRRQVSFDLFLSVTCIK